MASGFLQNSPGVSVRRLRQLARLAEPTDSGRTTDALVSCREIERLTSMEHRALRKYFRLLEADRALRARAGGGTAGMLVGEILEAERQRLGRELHTGVGQALAGIHIHASLLGAALADPPETVRKSVDQISALARTALDQVRGVSRGLYAPAWQAQSLVEALRNLWEASGISERFAGTLDLHEPSVEPPPEVRRAIYLVAQEGISNVIQHADACRVRMSLRAEGGRIALEVADDGPGFDTSPDPDRPAASAAIGLRSMRDLTRQLGGDLQAHSSSEGAKLTVSFPVSHE